jgi:hypothetical protein
MERFKSFEELKKRNTSSQEYKSAILSFEEDLKKFIELLRTSINNNSRSNLHSPKE